MGNRREQNERREGMTISRGEAVKGGLEQWVCGALFRAGEKKKEKKGGGGAGAVELKGVDHWGPLSHFQEVNLDWRKSSASRTSLLCLRYMISLDGALLHSYSNPL